MFFFSNLQNQLMKTFKAHNYQPKAWLLSSHRLNNQSIQLALDVRENRIPLMADNGTIQFIQRVLRKYRWRTIRIRVFTRRISRKLGRSIRPEDVPTRLRRRASKLTKKVVRNCSKRSNKINSNALLKKQLSMKPTHLIAQEDFAVACLMGLRLDREITGYSLEFFRERNLHSLKLWKKIAENPDCQKIKVYAVLSAMDYDTAVEASRLAAQEGVKHVAIGMASIMRDMSMVDFYRLGESIFLLEKPVRRRFVRFAEIIKGLRDGYELEERNLESFHGLGLGAPMLFPFLPMILGPDPDISVDSTSPILNVVRLNTLFDPEHNGDRISYLKIIKKILEGEDWPFMCPFCKTYKKDNRHDPEAARKWWHTKNKPTIRKKDLKVKKPLSKMLPLFTKHKKSSVANNCRIAHNHWVIEQFLKQVPSGDERVVWAEKKIDEIITYESVSAEKSLQVMKEILNNKKQIAPSQIH